MAITILLVVLGIAVGAVAGYFLRKPDAGYLRMNEELKAELENSKGELTTYKQAVAGHFIKTADLINNMTDSYRAVHEHLAVGAHTLCDDQLGVEQLDIKQTRLLDKSDVEEASQTDASLEPEKQAQAELEEELAQAPADAVPESIMTSSERKSESDAKTVH